jgi:diguanylate cyclase (GGDEF)-like protein
MHTDSMTAEDERLAALYRYDVLDTEPEEGFDRITRLAKMVMQTPIALVSLIDRERQWFKSRQGLEARETSRDISFCSHAIEHDVPMIVPDAREDPRFCDNPLVTGGPMIRFYLGVPLRTPDGQNIGTLCAIDQQPRQPSADQVALLEDLARLVIDELELRQLATTDSLTGALTRRGFMRAARQAHDLARRYEHAVTCIALDLDHFKSVNDRFGHAAGDQVLRTVTTICRSIMRSVDCLGRLGGEEFAIVLPETDIAGAQATAERLRQQIAATVVETAAGALSVTASFGVAALGAQDDIEAMVAGADAALYRAKAAGRNRVTVAMPPHVGLLSGSELSS